jgi:hypothetical protein
MYRITQCVPVIRDSLYETQYQQEALSENLSHRQPSPCDYPLEIGKALVYQMGRHRRRHLQ